MQTQTQPRPIVARGDNRNLRALERLDAEISAARKAVVGADTTAEQRSAEIITAAVFMADIMERDQDAWNAFRKRFDVKPCKGRDWQYRECARVVWRQFAAQAERQSRQRTSQYGKAISVAHTLFKDGTTTTRAALLKRIRDARGVKGLIALRNRMPKDQTSNRPRRFHLTELDRPTLVILKPGQAPEIVADDVARSILIKLKALQ